MTPVLRVHNLSKRFGAVQASERICLTLNRGEIHALIGPNGAGKSTLISQIAGDLLPDTGTIELDGQDVSTLTTQQRARLGLGRSFQVSALVPTYSVRDNILLALHGREGRAFRLFAPATRPSTLYEEVAVHAERVSLGDRLDLPAAHLSHGERRRLELAMVLALRPKAFLLDEPMAGLGNEGTEEMTALLTALKTEAPILLVEHDMAAVFALADRISVLVEGALLMTGPVDQIRTSAEVKRVYLGEEEDALPA